MFDALIPGVADLFDPNATVELAVEGSISGTSFIYLTFLTWFVPVATGVFGLANSARRLFRATVAVLSL